jgi:hypothetical protein
VTYRDELEAERARADALEQRVADLERQNQELQQRLAPPVATPLAPAAPAARGGGRLLVLMIAVAAAGVLAAIAIPLAIGGFSSKVQGVVTASGGELGSWTMHADSCQSGERNQFRGVEIFASDDKRLGMSFLQPIGGEAAVSLNIPGGTSARRFGASDCTVLRGEVHRQTSMVNRITNVRGRVKFDCRYGDEHATGDLTFENCH